MRIGVARSVFRDVPPGLREFAGTPLQSLFKARTGIEGEVVLEDDWEELAKKLDTGKLHLGVFVGHEFAWACQRHPALASLVCSVPRSRECKAMLLVRYDCPAKSLAELDSGKLAVGKNLPEYAMLFLDRQLAGQPGRTRNNGVETVDNVHDGIHQVIEGGSKGVVVETASWSTFQRLYPGPSQNLRVLIESEPFPPGTIAFRPGKLDEARLKSIRSGLTTAHQDSKCARLLGLMRIERLDLAPADYQDSLEACRKAYPLPTK